MNTNNNTINLLSRIIHTSGMKISLGSLRNHDSYGDESVTSSFQFEQSRVFHDDSVSLVYVVR